jgi:hypothetical protein
MTGCGLTVFIATTYRHTAVPLDVCPKSFLCDESGVFHLHRHSTFALNTSRMVSLSVLRALQKSSKRHSNRTSIRDTASFM